MICRRLDDDEKYLINSYMHYLKCIYVLLYDVATEYLYFCIWPHFSLFFNISSYVKLKNIFILLNISPTCSCYLGKYVTIYINLDPLFFLPGMEYIILECNHHLLGHKLHQFHQIIYFNVWILISSRRRGFLNIDWNQNTAQRCLI